LLGRVMASFYGQHAFHISTTAHLIGKHNSHMHDCSFLFSDEAYWPGDKNAEGVIKRMITEDTLIIEPKFVGPFSVANCLHIIIASEEGWAVPAGIDERRFVVTRLDEKYKQKETWFAPLYKQLYDGGGREAMLFDLLNMDLGDWHPRRIIQTAALQDHKIHSLDAKMRWWVDILNNRQLVYGCEHVDECPSDTLYDHYVKHIQKSGSRYTDSKTAFGIFLHDVAVGAELKHKRYQKYKVINRPGFPVETTGWVYVFPTLKDCRARIEKMGLKMDWMVGWKEDGNTWVKEEDEAVWGTVEPPTEPF
jgi:hypothetical protein